MKNSEPTIATRQITSALLCQFVGKPTYGIWSEGTRRHGEDLRVAGGQSRAACAFRHFLLYPGASSRPISKMAGRGGADAIEQLRMPDFVKVGLVSELGSVGQFSRWVGNHDILVFRWQGQIRAFTNVCPHFGGPVGFHKMVDGTFTCLWHNLQFSAETGQCLTVPPLKLREYKIKVEDDVIYAQLVEDQGQ